MTIKAGKDEGYTEWSVDFTPRGYPVMDDGTRPHKRIRFRIWVVNCDKKDEEIPDQPKKDDKKEDPPKKDDGEQPKESGGDTKEKPKSGAPNKLKSSTGLLIEEFSTPHGVVKVNLPDDVTAGDTISGTVIGVPAGKNPQEIARNEDVITGYVVEVEKQRTPAKDQIGRWLIPATAAGVTLALLDPRGHKVAEKEVPCLPLPTDLKMKPNTPVESPKPTDYTLPKIGQSGKPIQALGPFSGDMTGTSVKIGGNACPILAESPRKVVAIAPTTAGTSEMEVTENGVTARSEFQNIGVHGSVGKSPILPGEQTALTITVNGCSKPVPVRVTNHTPGVVLMAGGESRVVMVDPEHGAQVMLTGRTRGQFSMELLLNVDNNGLLADEKPGGFAPPIENQPLGSDKPITTPQEKIDGAFKKTIEGNAARERANEEERQNPGSADAKAARKAADDAERDAGRAERILTPDQRKQLNRDLSEHYKNAAKQNRQFADEDEKHAREARADRDDLRKQAKEETDPDRKQKLDKDANRQDQRAKDLDQDAMNERNRAAGYDAKSKAYGERAK